MTIEELKEKVLNLEYKIDAYVEEINKEIDKLKSEYIESECPFKRGDVWIRKYDGEKFTINKVELEDDFFTYENPDGAYIIYLDGEDANPFKTIFEYHGDFLDKYAKEGEIETHEDRLRKTSVQQSNDWLEKQNFNGFVNYAEL